MNQKESGENVISDPATMLMSLPGLLLAITLHELAHGFAADALGDPTPRVSGRLSFNPLVHLDLVGTLMLLFFRFGWAKPVPINPAYFRDRRRGMLLTSAAGPTANVLAAAFALYLLFQFSGLQQVAAGVMLMWFMQYNIWLAVFNMIPIPPLDGSHVAAALIPYHSPLRGVMNMLEQYGWMILMLLLISGLFGAILFPLATYLQRSLMFLVSLVVI